MSKTSYLLIALIVLTPFAALANPPAAILASYDNGLQELNVTVQHPVTDPKKHYIKKVVVLKNGKEVAEKTFTFQTSRRAQTMPPFHIDAKKGEKLVIKAFCSISGEGEKWVYVK